MEDKSFHLDIDLGDIVFYICVLIVVILLMGGEPLRDAVAERIKNGTVQVE
jgi:hypothetical protein